MSKALERLFNGIIKENPTFVLILGMCPTLAVTTCAINGLGMGLTTTAVLIMSNILISLLRKIIPDGVRSPSPAVSRDVKRGVMSVATSRTCALYATEGSFSAGVLSVENQGGEATVWATSLDEKPIERSCRLLVVRLGDIQSEGTVFADATCRKVLNWGSGYCMERGRSLISLRHDRPCAVWNLDISGRRRSRVAASWQDGRISFVADVAANPNEASFAYELVELP